MYFILPETKKNSKDFVPKKVLLEYYSLLQSYKFMLAACVPSLMFSAYMSFIACGSFLYMETFNLPIMYCSLHQGVLIACFSFVSNNAGKVCKYLGEREQ